MLAPMTNSQSHADGTLGNDEFRWLSLRAAGGFGMTMTCASHVHQKGQGFEGQLGIFSDRHIPGHQKLTEEIHRYESLAILQLFHAGMRAPNELIGSQAVSPSGDEAFNARKMTPEEIMMIRDDFVTAALRAKESGYDGVEIHGAHGYLLAQFLSQKYNRRTDRYGVTRNGRFKLIEEILVEVRRACGQSFLLGLRLSPERFGMNLDDCLWFCRRTIKYALVDFLDISLWDVSKFPEEPAPQDKPLLDHFTGLERGQIALTVAGKIMSGRTAHDVLTRGVDFVGIGRAGILHHDFPKRCMNNLGFEAIQTPVSRRHLEEEGLGKAFVDYMARWPGFVES